VGAAMALGSECDTTSQYPSGSWLPQGVNVGGLDWLRWIDAFLLATRGDA